MDNWIKEARKLNKNAEKKFIKGRKLYAKGEFEKANKYFSEGNVIKAKANKVIFDHQIDVRKMK